MAARAADEGAGVHVAGSMLASLVFTCVLATAPRTSDAAAVLAVLERSAADAEADPEKLVRELARLGPARVPDLFSVLAFGGGEQHALGAREEEALADAMASFGIAALRPFLNKRIASGPENEERLA